MTFAEVEKKYIEGLSNIYDEAEARNLAYYAIEDICMRSRSRIILDRSVRVSAQEELSLQMILDELQTGKPIQYILGETEFFGFTFKVNPFVLIPRPETEELVDWILTKVQTRNSDGDEQGKPLRILDIGTGSGCIPVSIKKKLPKAEVYGIDISGEALETAVKNAVLNQAEVEFLKEDILNPSARLSALTFDLIVSNPPYIAHKEKEQMHRNVLDFEPETALFVPDNDPLKFYRHIADFGIEHLAHNGLLFFEINENFGQETVELLTSKGFKRVTLRKDLAGKDRMVFAAL